MCNYFVQLTDFHETSLNSGPTSLREESTGETYFFIIQRNFHFYWNIYKYCNCYFSQIEKFCFYSISLVRDRGKNGFLLVVCWIQKIKSEFKDKQNSSVYWIQTFLTYINSYLSNFRSVGFGRIYTRMTSTRSYISWNESRTVRTRRRTYPGVCESTSQNELITQSSAINRSG